MNHENSQRFLLISSSKLIYLTPHVNHQHYHNFAFASFAALKSGFTAILG